MKTICGTWLAICMLLGASGAAVAESVTADAPAPKRAANLFTTTHVNFRAGPGTGHAKTGVIPGGQIVTVLGCLEGYRWCRVSWSGETGWVFAKMLDRPRLEGNFTSYAQGVGVPVIAFEPDTDERVAPDRRHERERVITVRKAAGGKADRLDGPISFAADPNSDLLGGDVGLQKSVGR